MKNALIAMSGGVDSSVAAYLIKESGYRCTGAIMRLCEDPSGAGITRQVADARCFDDSRQVADARHVASSLGIDFRVYDMRAEFRSMVIDDFVRAYENGATPNPCVKCNRLLKFGALHIAAVRDLAKQGRELMLATGHYAVTGSDAASGRYFLRKATDPSKDQSYFLYGLTQDQLSRTLFPLGSLTKAEVREIAEAQGFVTARRKESQDICFIPGGDYAGFIADYTGKSYPLGEFTDASGVVLGEHKGIIHYTIGQRKGLGIALGRPAYVCALDPEKNRVILGDNADLFKRELTASGFNWVSTAPQATDFRALARIRYRHKESSARVIPLSEDRVRIEFDEPQRAITRGQSVVLYDSDGGGYVLGGGIID